MIVAPIPMVVPTIVGEITLGSKCLNIMEAFEQFIASAASKYSFVLSARICPLVIRAPLGIAPIDSATIVLKNPGPRAVDTTMQSRRMGGVVPTPEEIVEALKNKFKI